MLYSEDILITVTSVVHSTNEGLKERSFAYTNTHKSPAKLYLISIEDWLFKFPIKSIKQFILVYRSSTLVLWTNFV